MAVAVDDIIEYTIRSQYQGSVILNVFHFKVSTTAPGVEDELLMIALDEWLEENVWGNGPDKILASQVHTYAVEYTRVQKVYPSRQRYYQYDYNVPGESDLEGIPSNVDMVASGQTNVAIRGATASKHWTGFVITDANDGVWNPLVSAKVLGAMNEMVPIIVLLDPAVVLKPVTFNPETGTNHEIVGWTVKPEVRVMRRRTKGYGI